MSHNSNETARLVNAPPRSLKTVFNFQLHIGIIFLLTLSSLNFEIVVCVIRFS
jgi:hypothetical protein